MMRKLDTRQREKILKNMEHQVLANAITKRVGRLRKLQIVDDKKIEKAFGALPAPRKRAVKRRDGGDAGA